MAPRIYTSDFPDTPILHTSIFTRVFGAQAPGDIGGFPASKKAFVDAATETALTRGDLLRLSLSFGHGIREHPVTAPFTRRGDTMLIYSQNSLAWPVVLFGCVAAGLRCTLANNAYVSRELAHQYRDSGSKLLVTAEDGIDIVRAMFAELGVSREEGDARTVVVGRDLRWAGGPAAPPKPSCSGLLTLSDLLTRGELEREELFEGPLAHETVYLCYSSGTTGNPKGVETTHQNMTTIMDIVRDEFPKLSGNETALGILPFYHIYGNALLIHLPFTLGWTVLIQPQFEPVQFCATIEKFRVSFAFIVPPVLIVLARHPAVDEFDLSSLEYMLSAAAPLGADLVKQVKTRLLAKRAPGALCVVTQGYGLTETTTGTHLLLFNEAADRKVGSVGTLLANLEARIVHDEDGLVEAEEGKPGELWVRGKTVMKGYLNNPQATSNAITPDGWFKTGDIVTRDSEGFFYVVDRRKELIKYKGFQVPPAELEALLLTHPDIADAAVIGVDSQEQATELPRAYVVHARPQKIKTKTDVDAFAKALAQWMESRVAKHKLLRGGVSVIEAVPKSAAGKILRRELRELAKLEAARGEINTEFGFKSKL
ncbi:AMP binding protein [Mycena filopes]|nr:AMP binding protein [Mycena filopes]